MIRRQRRSATLATAAGRILLSGPQQIWQRQRPILQAHQSRNAALAAHLTGHRARFFPAKDEVKRLPDGGFVEKIRVELPRNATEAERLIVHQVGQWMLCNVFLEILWTTWNRGGQLHVKSCAASGRTRRPQAPTMRLYD